MFPPPHGGEDIGHKEQNQHDEHKLYRAVLVQHFMDWCIAAHLSQWDFGDGDLPQPEGSGEEIQEKQYRTEREGFAKAFLFVVFENVPVVDKPQYAPYGQEQIGFGFQGAAQEQIGNDGAEEEKQGKNETGSPQSLAG